MEANFEPNTGSNSEVSSTLVILFALTAWSWPKITPLFPASVFPDVKSAPASVKGNAPLIAKYPHQGEKPRPCHSRKRPGLSRTPGLPRPRGIESGDLEGGSGCLELPGRRGHPVALRDLGQGPFFPPKPSASSFRGVLGALGCAGRPGRPACSQASVSPPATQWSLESTSGSGSAVAAVWGRSGLPAGLPGGGSDG